MDLLLDQDLAALQGQIGSLIETSTLYIRFTAHTQEKHLRPDSALEGEDAAIRAALSKNLRPSGTETPAVPVAHRFTSLHWQSQLEAQLRHAYRRLELVHPGVERAYAAMGYDSEIPPGPLGITQFSQEFHAEFGAYIGAALIQAVVRGNRCNPKLPVSIESRLGKDGLLYVVSNEVGFDARALVEKSREKLGRGEHVNGVIALMLSSTSVFSPSGADPAKSKPLFAYETGGKRWAFLYRFDQNRYAPAHHPVHLTH
ncbi:MAG: hypothetical protein Q7S65_02825 [Nanoarchaeota archaeon]|nr:hypothetical protein [Nanoarchaeota archaeon]